MKMGEGFSMETQEVERNLLRVWIEDFTGGENTYPPADGMNFENVEKIVKFAEENNLLAGLTYAEAIGLACFYVGFGTGAGNVMHRMGMHVPGFDIIELEGDDE